MHTALSTARSLARSLTVAVCIGFLVPVLSVSIVMILLGVGTYLPGLDWVSQVCLEGFLSVLAIFGTGHPVEGVAVIGGAFAFVSALFDGYVMYCQRVV